MSVAVPDILAVEDQGEFWDDHRALVAGLSEPVPRIPPWFGYDERGARLYEQITELSTYYLTRVERALIERHCEDMADRMGTGCLVELGSGSAKKTAVLLAACLRRRPITYLPVDVTREMLVDSAAELTATLPGLTVRGLWGRYEAALSWLRVESSQPLVVAFLGSSLGNATVDERRDLLAEIATSLRPGDGLLVSADLRKPAEELETCYNDPRGATAFAEFRLNHLAHLNGRFDGDFDLDRFEPRAHYDEASGTVQGHLYATSDQAATLRTLGLTVRLRRGESINVGFSAKFDHRDFLDELAGHGLNVQAEWLDPVARYGVFLLRR